MKRFLSLILSAALLTVSAGCAAPAKDFAVAKAVYPQLTNYKDQFDRVSKLEQSGMSTWEDLEQAYDELNEAMTANSEELQALRKDAAADVPSLTDFTARTVAELFANREENTVFSPANLYLALAMLSEATDGNTRDEVLSLMGSTDPRTAANALWKMIYSDGRGKTLAANSLWTGEVYPVKQALADTLAKHHYADSYTIPMGTPEGDKVMQTWINDHTGGLLQDAAEGVQTSPETVLTLISTLYFEQMWADKFEEHATAKDTFTKADGSEITTDFMHDGGSGAWYQGENYVMAGRSFQNSGGRMIFILPDEGVLPEELLTDADTLAEILTTPHDQYTRIEWSVPKFDVSSDLQLNDQLQALGIKQAFNPKAADFTPATDVEDVALSQVKHAARVTIDENGCTAAAFTVMMMNTMGLPPDAVLEMNLNRPFAFVILNDADIPLFIGTVYNP